MFTILEKLTPRHCPATANPGNTLDYGGGVSCQLLTNTQGEITAKLWISPDAVTIAQEGDRFVVYQLRDVPGAPLVKTSFATCEEAVAFTEQGCRHCPIPAPVVGNSSYAPHAFATKEGKSWVVYAWGETVIGRYADEATAWYVADEVNNPPWGGSPDWEYINQY